MSITIFIPVLVSLIVGGVLLYFGRRFTDYRVNGPEFAIGLVVTIFLVSWPVSAIGEHMARDSVVEGYHEFWNGSVIAAEESGPITCTRDGDCHQTYDCDPYKVVDEEAYFDSKGRYHSEKSHTEYHSCPEATIEHNYWIRDSLGRKIDIYVGAFESHPHRWGGRDPSSDVLRGAPAYWLQAQQSIAQGNPLPVTKVNEYSNYLLSSTHTILKRYSPDIKRYKPYLVAHTANYSSPMYAYDTMAQKVMTVGDVKVNVPAWNDALARLNAQLGTERQGDMHIVMVPADKVDPDSYINAVMAYWQDTSVFGKWALGKNAIAVAIGVADNKVAWMRAKTGMPVDNNGGMSTAIMQLKDLPLDPAVVIGTPRAVLGKKLTWTPSNGAIEHVVLHSFPFVRACMGKCGDKGDSGTGFVYLKKDVEIPTDAKVYMILIALFLNACVWAALYFLPAFDPIEKSY